MLGAPAGQSPGPGRRVHRGQVVEYARDEAPNGPFSGDTRRAARRAAAAGQPPGVAGDVHRPGVTAAGDQPGPCRDVDDEGLVIEDERSACQLPSSHACCGGKPGSKPLVKSPEPPRSPAWIARRGSRCCSDDVGSPLRSVPGAGGGYLSGSGRSGRYAAAAENAGGSGPACWSGRSTPMSPSSPAGVVEMAGPCTRSAHRARIDVQPARLRDHAVRPGSASKESVLAPGLGHVQTQHGEAVLGDQHVGSLADHRRGRGGRLPPRAGPAGGPLVGHGGR